MARGGASIFISLLLVFIITLILLTLVRAIIFALNPDLAVQWDENVQDNAWIVFIQLMDPGNMAQDIQVRIPLPRGSNTRRNGRRHHAVGADRLHHDSAGSENQ